VDHLGLIISGVVGAASCTDRDGLDVLCYFAKEKKIQLPKKVYADLGYSGEDMKLRLLNYGIELETVGRRDKKTFIVEPKRWIVERTFAWLGKFRRHSKDYELITSTSTAMIYLAMSRLMVARLSVL
jgi:putative transposase